MARLYLTGYSCSMKDYGALFRGKKITVLGLGLLGRGVGDVEFLAKCGADVLVTDKKSEAELAESVERLKQYKNVSFKLGGHSREDFTNCDMVIKAAGVPLGSPEIAVAHAAKVPVAMSTALFAKHAMETGVKIVGVTGTRGKSTVTHMIHHCLNEAEKHLGLNRAEGAVGRTIRHRRIVLGGNIRGISTLAMLSEVGEGDIAVLELDSWQLQGFGDLEISPNISIFTNLLSDHQNYYKDMDEYFADKANIFNFQGKDDSLFVGPGVLERVRKTNPPVDAVVPTAIPEEWKLRIPGEHNRENASFAVAALYALGIRDSDIRSGIESFEGVEGRLQFLGESKGIKIYNDNNATTPEATIAGLRALRQGSGQNQNIILILGGSDKGLDMSALIKEVNVSCKKVLFLAGTGTARIAKDLTGFPIFENLESAFNSAVNVAEDGDTILFSPAFASFGMFRNEYERNDQFVKLAQEHV